MIKKMKKYYNYNFYGINDNELYGYTSETNDVYKIGDNLTIDDVFKDKEADIKIDKDGLKTCVYKSEVSKTYTIFQISTSHQISVFDETGEEKIETEIWFFNNIKLI